MGNKVASEGEDMADSPKAGVGEIVPSKKKHRSFRRRLADKFRKSKHKKEYQEDKEQIVLQKNSSQPQPKTLNTRKNYYKNLGISQLSNGDRVNYSPYHRAITSAVSELSPRAHTRTGKEHVTSYSHIALAKAKSRAENDRKKVSCDSPSKGGFSDFLPDKEETKISIPSKLDYRENDVEELKNGRNTTPDSRKSLEDLLDKDKDDSTTADTFSINDTDKEEQDFKLDFLIKNQERSGDTMRRKFLSKLTQEKVWLTPSEKPKTHQTCIIYDWDDTLLCTTFLNPTNWGNFELPLNVKVHLKKLEKAWINILTESLNYGDVYIITNAADGWVEFSARKYLPNLTPILEKITIMSARAICETEYPTDIHQWKMKAFLKTQEKMEKGAITNLVALGDSQFEMDAVKNLGSKFSRALIKTVKFREAPTPDELVKQINLIVLKLDQIWTAGKNLTIKLERKEKTG